MSFTTSPRSVPGKGSMRHSKSYLRRIVVGFDEETFEQVRTRALAERTSFGEQVRILVEFGLEAE